MTTVAKFLRAEKAKVALSHQLRKWVADRKHSRFMGGIGHTVVKTVPVSSPTIQDLADNKVAMPALTLHCAKCEEPAANHRDFGEGRYVIVENNGWLIYCNRNSDNIGSLSTDFFRSEGNDIPVIDLQGAESLIVAKLDRETYEVSGQHHEWTEEVFDNDFLGDLNLPVYWFGKNVDPNAKTKTISLSYTEGTLEDEVDYESADLELRKLERWVDRHPKEFTLTLAQHQAGMPMPSRFDDEDTTTAYVEGEAFQVETVIDPVSTDRYHKRIFNVFTDKKTGLLRVGGVTIHHNADNSVTAKCWCGQQLNDTYFIKVPKSLEEAYREFTYAVIAHGHKHSRVFTNRRIFDDHGNVVKEYEVTLSQAKKEHNAKAYLTPLLPNPSDEDLLSSHLAICSNPDCQHAKLLADQTQ